MMETRVKKPSVKNINSFKSSRARYFIINRHQIGYTNLKHKHLITEKNPLLCDTWATPVTVRHIPSRYYKFQWTRDELDNPNNLWTLNTPCILAAYITNLLIKFLNSSQSKVWLANVWCNGNLTTSVHGGFILNVSCYTYQR